MHEFDILLFDLGGVLVELSGVPTMHQWSDHKYDDEELWAVWLKSPAVRSFETGATDACQFAAQIIDEMALSIDADEFLEKFTQWPTGLFPGVTEMLAGLKPHFTIACLSNTNELHWPRLMDEMGLQELFHHHYSSHHLGMLKPDPEVFEFVLGNLNCPPDRVLFLDDNVINVVSAKQLGLKAYTVKGPEDIKQLFARLDIPVAQI